MTDGRPRCLLLVAAALTAGACGGHGESTAKQVEPSRCKAVPPALVKVIATRLPAQEKLRGARAVASGDSEWVWFISAEIRGPALEKPGDIGTWAKTGALAVGDGQILSVDSVFAQQLSGWYRGELTFANLTMDDVSAQGHTTASRPAEYQPISVNGSPTASVAGVADATYGVARPTTARWAVDTPNRRGWYS